MGFASLYAHGGMFAFWSDYPKGTFGPHLPNPQKTPQKGFFPFQIGLKREFSYFKLFSNDSRKGEKGAISAIFLRQIVFKNPENRRKGGVYFRLISQLFRSGHLFFRFSAPGEKGSEIGDFPFLPKERFRRNGILIPSFSKSESRKEGILIPSFLYISKRDISRRKIYLPS